MLPYLNATWAEGGNLALRYLPKSKLGTSLEGQFMDLGLMNEEPGINAEKQYGTSNSSTREMEAAEQGIWAMRQRKREKEKGGRREGEEDGEMFSCSSIKNFYLTSENLVSYDFFFCL